MNRMNQWSPDEMRVLRQLRKRGYNTSIIAKNLKRSKLQVIVKLTQIL